MAKSWTQKGGFSTYGKSALSANLKISGLEEYLKKIAAAGKNVDAACRKAINESTSIIKNSMDEGAQRHRRTGETAEAIEKTKAKPTGNYNYATVGIDLQKHPNAAHAVFREYGDGHSPEFPDPFIRPAVDNNRKQVAKIQRTVLKKEGVPID